MGVAMLITGAVVQPHRRRSARCCSASVDHRRAQPRWRAFVQTRCWSDRRTGAALGPRQRALHRDRPGHRSSTPPAARSAQAIILYEAALGLGIAVGPAGRRCARGRFRGAARSSASVLMAFALVADRVPAARPLRRPERATTLARPVPRAAAPRSARRGDHRAALQLRVLHAAGVHAVPAGHDRAPDRADLLRLGYGPGVYVGGAWRRGCSTGSAPCRRCW